MPGEDMVKAVTGQVAASFSQFYLHVGDDSTIYDMLEPGLGLAHEHDDDRVMITAPRQSGACVVRAEVHDQEPSVLDEWTDLIEFSVTAGDSTTVESWGRDGAKFAVPAVHAGITYRVRYIIVDGQLANDEVRIDAPPATSERYIFQFWPAVAGPPEVIRCQSPWARYWEHPHE